MQWFLQNCKHVLIPCYFFHFLQIYISEILLSYFDLSERVESVILFSQRFFVLFFVFFTQVPLLLLKHRMGIHLPPLVTRFVCFHKKVPGRRPESYNWLHKLSFCRQRNSPPPSCFQSLAFTWMYVFFSPLSGPSGSKKRVPPSLCVVLWSEAPVVLLQTAARASFQSAPRSLLIIKRCAALQAPPLFLRQRYIHFLFFLPSPLGVAYRLARADKLAGANLLPLRGGWALRVGQPLPSPSGH